MPTPMGGRGQNDANSTTQKRLQDWVNGDLGNVPRIIEEIRKKKNKLIKQQVNGFTIVG